MARLHPALQLSPYNLFENIHTLGAVVKTGDMGKFLAAIMQENLAGFTGNFFKRLKTIRYEAGIHDGDALDAF